jgi:hypothetical protein
VVSNSCASLRIARLILIDLIPFQMKDQPIKRDTVIKRTSDCYELVKTEDIGEVFVSSFVSKSFMCDGLLSIYIRIRE